MVIVAISDLHGNLRALDRILEQCGACDIILLAGDLTHFGSSRDVDALIERCRQKTAVVYAVAGNCDTREVVTRLEEAGVDLAGRGVVLNQLGLHGVPGIPHWRPGMYQFTEEELRQMLEKGWSQIGAATHRLTLAHAPPRNCTVDRVFWGCHVGSTALKEFIEKYHPSVVVCGHIHEGRGLVMEDNTQIVNCGHGASGYYARIIMEPSATSHSILIELFQA